MTYLTRTYTRSKIKTIVEEFQSHVAVTIYEGDVRLIVVWYPTLGYATEICVSDPRYEFPLNWLFI